MGGKLYYTPPCDKQFEEVKEKAKEVWFEVQSDHTYLQEKVSRIDGLQNIGDNFMYIVAMFDVKNQQKLANKLSEDTKQSIHDRIIDGGGFDGIFK
jgi:hypothetical protein